MWRWRACSCLHTYTHKRAHRAEAEPQLVPIRGTSEGVRRYRMLHTAVIWLFHEWLEMCYLTCPSPSPSPERSASSWPEHKGGAANAGIRLGELSCFSAPCVHLFEPRQLSVFSVSAVLDTKDKDLSWAEGNHSCSGINIRGLQVLLSEKNNSKPWN